MYRLYEFIDTVERPKKVAPSLQTLFNDINLDKALTDGNGSFITLTVYGRNNYAQQIKTFEVPGLDGVVEQNEPRAEPREITVKFKIQDKDSSSLQERLNSLRSLLQGAKKRLVFTDESAYFYATFADLELPEEESNNLVGTITFLCSDPKKYSLTERNLLFPADIVTVENNGTAEALPIFELEATQKTTFAMVSNQDDEYNLVGQPADDDVQVVDTRKSVLYENGSTIDTWSTASLDMLDNHFVKNIGGTMTSDGAGIRADGYGTGDKLHGPAVYKEIEPIQDFEIETTFDIISRREVENFRMGINFLDENMNMLGTIAIKDNSRTYKRRVPLARYGPYRGSGSKNGYLIGDNQKNDKAREITLFYLRAKRQGKRFDFYIGEWQNQKHVRYWSGTYNDVNNLYQGKLKYITLYIAKWGDRPNPARLRINSVEVFELARVTEDHTPYILYPGDILEFDHIEKDIRLNGESRKDLKNFGASFFTLKKGENMLVVTPENSFRTRVKFRERYL